jgi:hypothetical protein
MIWLVLILVLALIGGYFLFRDTMNRIQYIERIRLYWATRDTASGGPHIKNAWMRQVEAPYWRGEGIEFRFGKHTFQIGILKEKGSSLQSQISNLTEYNPPAYAIRKWGRDDEDS